MATINKYNGVRNRSKRTSSVQYIVQHYTAGTGSAKNNCDYFEKNPAAVGLASCDFFIDKDGTVWQYNCDLSNYYTWQVGDGKGKYGITNQNSVGIEYVSAGEDFTAAQIQAGADVTKMLMSQFNVPASRVVRHYDASRKSCPAPYINSSKWSTLHSQLTGGSAVTNTVVSSSSSSSSTGTAFTATLNVDGQWGVSTTKKAQTQAGTTIDGSISNQPSVNKKYVPCCYGSVWEWKSSGYSGGSALVRKIQSTVGADVDGYFGTGTAKAVQTYLVNKGYSVGNSGCDGYFGSDSCKAFQRCLNDKKFF